MDLNKCTHTLTTTYKPEFHKQDKSHIAFRVIHSQVNVVHTHQGGFESLKKYIFFNL